MVRDTGDPSTARQWYKLFFNQRNQMFCAAHNQTFQVCLARFLVSRVKSEMLSREEFLMQPDSFGAGGYFNIQNKAFKHLYLVIVWWKNIFTLPLCNFNYSFDPCLDPRHEGTEFIPPALPPPDSFWGAICWLTWHWIRWHDHPDPRLDIHDPEHNNKIMGQQGSHSFHQPNFIFTLDTSRTTHF